MTTRPDTFKNIIGQKSAKFKCETLIKSSKRQKKVIPHILFSGPSGTGKTTFAKAIANEYGKEPILLNGNNIRTPKDMIYILEEVVEGDILFIDEFQGIGKKVSEFLLTVLEDFEYTDNGDYKEIPRFTCIAATTHSGKLPFALLKRFPHKHELDEYTEEELIDLTKVKSLACGVDISTKIAKVIAKTCRGNPREITHRAEWLKDVMVGEELKNLSGEKAIEIIEYQGFDRNGLTKSDLKYLDVLNKDGITGLKTLSFKIDVSLETIETEIEPYLARIGLIAIESKGRRLKKRKYKDLGYGK